ncbi:MAG TPA: hypothetical protein VEB86_11230 [Chryseosolibacter sp.]|nr:hypothetical protein [Chryseosolibacter sp.]
MTPLTSNLTQAGFVLLTIVYFFLFTQEVFSGADATAWSPGRKQRFKRKWILGLVAWAIFVSVWSGTGIMGNFDNFPFNFLPVIAVPLVVAIVLTRSRSFGEILYHVRQEQIIQLQSFRFFVEILLWLLFIGNIVPEQMTFEGRNLDILSGITGPVVAWLLVRGKMSRTALIIWNVLCLLLLINIVAVAILSTPSPIRVFMNEPSNTVVTTFPASWLPGFLVPLAYLMHFFSLKQLLSFRERTVPEVH